ncbi:hypothetical protein NBRC116493_02780 [Aurantivibrio infirmus]
MGMIDKLLIGAASIWFVFVIYSYVSAFATAGSFEQALRGTCPSLNIHVLPRSLNMATISRKEWVNLIAWYDNKTGKEIYITPESYRQYKSTYHCDRKLANANLQLSKASSREVTPILRIKWGYFCLVLLPAFLLVGLAFLSKTVKTKARGKA